MSLPGQAAPANPVDLSFQSAFGARVQRASARLSRQSQWRLYTGALIASDVLMTTFAFWLAYQARFRLNFSIFQLDVIPSLPFYLKLAGILLPAWVLIFAAGGLYQQYHLLGGVQEYARVFRATTVGMLFVIVAGFLEPTFILARGWLLLAWFFAFLLVASGRFCLRRAVYFLRQHGYFLTPALIIGANGEGQSLAQQLIAWRTSGLHVVGFVDDQHDPSTNHASRITHQGLPILGHLDNLNQLIRQHAVTELILATSALSRDQMLAIFTRYGLVDGFHLRLSSGLFEIITTGLEVKEMAYVPLLRVNKVRLTGLDRALKLLLDYTIAIPALLLAALPMLLIAVAIKLDSPGPAIHRRRVMGLNGRPFDAYKFRTVVANGDEILAANPALHAQPASDHKLKDDPRVTRFGRFLRAWSLDELPQLFNVLRCQMSLVGPRMIASAEMEKYDQWALNLLTVPPGITGLWQVNGRADVSYDERVRLDMHYIRNWTIWLDLQLLIQTIPAVLGRKGAY